ncbi:flagellar export protein FliJ [Fuchsiella alkaliacetigena]|uniref:flagellar export protein FliJ n=1 Tax=Fuchsiella alkaliacetigena TaxID=957042 RepID=UPI00200B2EA9|nr:flagellar export protein FliJ [Fuchsiella alkaliacetigena]MCK8823551.1 flagellar export protein FliJ [Fuchsiella alkaliacetigena]
MKKFEFKLQTVLNYRQQEEDMFKQQLARARLELNKAQDKLDSLLTNKKDIQAQLKKSEREGIDIHQAMLYRDYIAMLKNKIIEQIKVVNKKQQHFDKCKQKLLDKAKECKILDKLKERREEEHQQEFLRQQQKAIDEVAGNSFNRQNASEEVII